MLKTGFRKIQHHGGQLFEGFLTAAGVIELDAIIPLHSHFDHFLDTPYYLNRFKTAKLIGSHTSIEMAKSALRPNHKSSQFVEISLENNPSFKDKIGSFNITIENAIHGDNCLISRWAPIESFPDSTSKGLDFSEPRAAGEYVEGGSFNIAIEHRPSKKTYYILGGQVPEDLRENTLLKKANVVFTAVKVAGSKDEESKGEDFRTWLWQQLSSQGDKTIVPVHWDSFFKPLEPGCKSDGKNCLKRNPFLIWRIKSLIKEVNNANNLSLKCLDAFDELNQSKSKCSLLL